MQQIDDSNIAPKIARQTVTQAAITDVGESAMDPNSALPPSELRGTLNEWRVYIRHYTLEFGGSVGPEQAAKSVYDKLEVKRNALHNKLKQASSPTDRAMIMSKMTDIGRDMSILNEEFELFPNLVVPPPTAVYSRGRGHDCGCGIIRGRGRGGNNSVSAGGKGSHAIS